MAERPEPFYKDEFCKALTNYTHWELLDVVTNGYVDKVDGAIGRDMPRSDGDRFVDRYMLFLTSRFRGLIVNDLSPEKAYETFTKFRDFESFIHTHDGHRSAPEYDPIYRTIEQAFECRDDTALFEGIESLLDFIIHD